MPISGFVFDSFQLYLGQGLIDFRTATLKCALLTSAATPNKNTHERWSDLSSSEVAQGDGYTTGGVALTNVVLAKDGGNSRVYLDADNVEWNPSSITARYAVAYVDNGADSYLFGCIDFGENKVSDNDRFRINVNVLGLGQWRV